MLIAIQSVLQLALQVALSTTAFRRKVFGEAAIKVELFDSQTLNQKKVRTFNSQLLEMLLTRMTHHPASVTKEPEFDLVNNVLNS